MKIKESYLFSYSHRSVATTLAVQAKPLTEPRIVRDYVKAVSSQVGGDAAKQIQRILAQWQQHKKHINATNIRN